MRALLTLSLVLSVVSYGCDNSRSTPLAPTPPPAPGLSIPPSPYWNLTTTLVDVTGRSVCPHWPLEIGRSAEWLLDVRRTNNALTLVYDVRNIPTDHLELVGRLNGDAFEASMAYPGYQPCGGSQLVYDFESRVSGQFSADGTRISARETWSYRVASGDALVMSFDWNARASVSSR
jgi:hypothetical protein